MKVLSIINISNPDDLSCDSGVIFQRTLSEEFVKQGIIYTIAAPKSVDLRPYFSEEVRIVPISSGTTRYSSRYNFNWDEMVALIDDIRPDIIFNNQVEITAAIKSILESSKNTDSKIVAYCHYPAIWGVKEGVPVLDGSLNHGNLGTSIVFDILSALLAADSFVIQSDFAKGLIDVAAQYHKLPPYKDIKVISPPLDNHLGAVKVKSPTSNKKVFYNHRLYESYGTGEFLDFIKQNKDLGFNLVVSDPMPNRSVSRQSLSSSPLAFKDAFMGLPYVEFVNGNVDRASYRRIILDSRVAFGAYRKACVWSMSALDCMSQGIPVITPDYAAYPEFIPNELRFGSKGVAREILLRLLNDDDAWNKASEECYKVSLGYKSDIIASKFIEIFKSLQRH